ncbi:MAG: sigma-54 dependent transcriptional regulator [Stappiaceae bacterium]
MNSKRFLLVEDTVSIAVLYCAQLRAAGLNVDHLETGGQALEALETGRYDVLLLDLQLPDMSGFDVMREIKARDISITTIVVTGQGSVTTAVEAMRVGAYDFVVKPVSQERLITTARNALERSSLRETVRSLNSGVAGGKFGFVGQSLAMRTVYRMIESVARSRATVFITGESGTGKEVCAEAVHRVGARRDKKFIAINCAAIPKDLMESEIFGHIKGAFTGAIGDRTGAAIQADGGTLFLDEICEMDIALQSKLLRFLQTGRVQRVGDDRLAEVDVRVICATNRNPAEEVAQGRFREDLYYRLHVLPLHLPPLRDREGDVIEIALHLLHRYAKEEGKEFETFSTEAQEFLVTHQWPGNVRELQNAVRNAIVLNEGTVIERPMLAGNNGKTAGAHMASTTPNIAPINESFGGFDTPVKSARISVPLGQSLADIEKQVIEATIEACSGSLPKAAKVLDVSPSTLYRKREGWNG